MMSDETRARFAAFADQVEATSPRARWLVLTHDNPDPDALAATAVLAMILRRRFKRRTTVAYGGMIGRAENREMVRSLKLELSHLRHLRRRDYQHFALVDCQPWTGNSQLPKGVLPDLVIDHHPLRKATQSARLADVRPAYGATATILLEYLEAAGLQPTRALSTGLVYAIRSETQDFGREAAGPDHAAYDRLLPRIDRRLLARIQTARLPLSYFQNLHRAIEGLAGVGNLVVSSLGRVDQPDIVPEIADLLLRMEGKTWSLCTGTHGDRLYLSIRTTNPRADAGNLMRRLIGKRGKGGGHGTLAGGFIAVDESAPEATKALERSLARRFATALRRNPDKLLPLGVAAPRALREVAVEPNGSGEAREPREARVGAESERVR
jgi:nanoRNase/pAp phosphatase (c-di-AMP/oligoRNAs hydrolase)